MACRKLAWRVKKGSRASLSGALVVGGKMLDFDEFVDASFDFWPCLHSGAPRAGYYCDPSLKLQGSKDMRHAVL